MKAAKKRIVTGLRPGDFAVWLVIGLLACGFAAVMTRPSYAADSRPIKSITLNIKANIVPGTNFGDEDIEIDGGGSRFSVDGYDILNDDSIWRDDTVPKLRITLTANDSYYFQYLPKDKITLKGGAEFIQSTRADSNSTMYMDVQLPSLQNTLRDVTHLKLSDNGMATWDPISAAGSYEVRVYRNGNAVGTGLVTDTNSCNCRTKMTKGDTSYTVQVRPVSRYDQGEKGRWVESDGIYISNETASGFRQNPGGGSGEWKQSAENGKWWYDNGDGTYPADNWKQIGGKWYFFDAQGYMQTGWIQWKGKEYYCSENGDMQTNCMTPDNYYVGEDGAKVSQ